LQSFIRADFGRDWIEFLDEAVGSELELMGRGIEGVLGLEEWAEAASAEGA